MGKAVAEKEQQLLDARNERDMHKKLIEEKH